MRLLSKIALTVALLAGFSAAAKAQLGYGGGTYFEDADSFLGTAATVPAGWSYSFSGMSTYKGVGNGSSLIGGAWAYGTLTDHSFGALRSGTPGNITLSLSLMNTTGSTITDLVIAFNYEQWRYANTSGWDLSGTGALAGNSTVNAADFTGLATGVNGTPVATPVSLTLTGLAIPNGALFGLSWVTTDATDSDNGVAVDNFTLTANAAPVPEPSVYMLLGVGLLFCGQRFLRGKRP